MVSVAAWRGTLALTDGSDQYERTEACVLYEIAVDELCDAYAALCVAEAGAPLVAEVKRLKAWVNDLQAGMYINCVYCGHRYGPDTEVAASMAEVLKEHIAQCAQHPLRAAMAQVRELVEVLRAVEWPEIHHRTAIIGRLCPGCGNWKGDDPDYNYHAPDCPLAAALAVKETP